jgi:deoxyribose-phosphate aldolase
MKIEDYSRLIDHTNLKPDATEQQIAQLCQEAVDYAFCMVAINQVQTRFCANFLRGTSVHTGAAIAFPLGQTSIAAKAFEAQDAINQGAQEIDFVLNLTEVKKGNHAYTLDEMGTMVEVCRRQNIVSKIIFETAYLTLDEIATLCHLANQVKPNFVKTSTGFAPKGATLEHVRLMRQECNPQIQVKAAGGIRDVETFLAMIEAGATRIGTSSGIKIIEDLKKRSHLSENN